MIEPYLEKVRSAGRVERAEYDYLLRGAAEPACPGDHLLVWSLDRCSREQRFIRAVGAIWNLERLGVWFHSLKEPLLDTPEDGQPNLAREILLAPLQVLAA